MIWLLIPLNSGGITFKSLKISYNSAYRAVKIKDLQSMRLQNKGTSKLNWFKKIMLGNKDKEIIEEEKEEICNISVNS